MGITVEQKGKLKKPSISEDKLQSQLAVYNMSFEQAKLGAIWQNPSVTSICSLMPTSAIMKSNVLAAIDNRPFNNEINKLLTAYSNSTRQYYCIRCGACDTAIVEKIPTFEIMEMLLYSRGYGARNLMAKKFNQIPSKIRNKINTTDYSEAEKKCPQKIPIAKFVKEAYQEFSE